MTRARSQNLFPEGTPGKKGVECLGLKFASEDERRRSFTEKLRERLRDPEFRKIEGFPVGSDEDILALSDPPYYTACPNPFIQDFVRFFGKPYDASTDDYHREPFAADVSEGKNDPIYNAHSYHTKVPHKAIMRYILHYTQPGDIVFDGFAGTGMTGVAAQLCGNRGVVESLGYQVQGDGKILDEAGQPVALLGQRRAILNDLAPAATFIAYNYNTPVDVRAFEQECRRILEQAERDCGWMYSTLHQPKSAQLETATVLLKRDAASIRRQGPDLPWGRINYTIWSDVFLCGECGKEIVFWDAAADLEVGAIRDEFPCPHCNARQTKRSMDRAWVTFIDKAIKQTVRQARQVPVMITYTFGGCRFEKRPDAFDHALVEKIANSDSPLWLPSDRMPDGEESRRNDDAGITHIHHFYTPRNAWVLAALRSPGLSFWLPFNALTPRATRMHRIAGSRLGGAKKGQGGATVGVISGTLYVPSISVEMNVLDQADDRIDATVKAKQFTDWSVVTTQSATQVQLPDASVDYVFTDPPFGGNLIYSELNFLWEGWLKVFTNNVPEAIENSVQRKTLLEYQELMTRCFGEYHRVLKPGRWMTVEFHNSRNSVWTAIQEGLQRAGFVISDVRTLDRQQGSFKQVTSTGAVKQDLILSAYKPDTALEERFRLKAGTEEGAWDFVRTHLAHLPVFVATGGKVEVVAERQGYLLFDRMVAFNVQRGVTVPMSAAEFYAGLRQRFPERDEMFFLPTQITEYERKRQEVDAVEQRELLVSDEKSAIQWVGRELHARPLTYADLQPLYMREAQRVWDKHEQPIELQTILDQNFVKDTDGRWRLPDPRKEADLEQLRHRHLLLEFLGYQGIKGKLKQVRTEAIRAGFKECWQKGDYSAIVQMAKRLPEAVVQEDPAILMYHDNALMRVEG